MIILGMQLSDLDQVMTIEKASFPTPWKRSFFEYDLRRKGGYCFVAKENDEILGYVNAWHIGDELHLANIAVAGKSRHQGIGSALLTKIIDIALENNCTRIFLEVRVSNTIGQKFYEKFGFTTFYLRKKYYPDGEDAIVYGKNIVLGFKTNQLK